MRDPRDAKDLMAPREPQDHGEPGAVWGSVGWLESLDCPARGVCQERRAQKESPVHRVTQGSWAAQAGGDHRDLPVCQGAVGTLELLDP